MRGNKKPMITQSWPLSPDCTLHRYRGRAANLYLLEDRGHRTTQLVDCGMPSDVPDLISCLKKLPELAAVFCTHFHIDHIAGWLELRKTYPRCPIRFHQAARPVVLGEKRLPSPSIRDIQNVLIPCMQESGYVPSLFDVVKGRLYGTPYQKGFPIENVQFYSTGDDLTSGFTCLHTPGHSPDSASFYHDIAKILICGDVFLSFKGIIVPNTYTVDATAQIRTLRQIAFLGTDVLICPGHGEPGKMRPESK